MPSTFIIKIVQSVFILVLIINSGTADFNPVFHRISVEDGLANDLVYRFAQDNLGYMWIGTQDGLSRYDGYGFKNFYYDPQDSHSLPGNAISIIYQDQFGRLWIGTQSAIALYNYDEKRFDRLPAPAVTCIIEGKDNTFWLSSYLEGLIKITNVNEAPGKMRISRDVIKFKDKLNVRTMLAEGDSMLWLATNNEGLIKYKLHDGTYEQFLYNPGSKQIRHSNSVQCMSIDPENPDAFWLGTDNHGLITFDTRDETFRGIRMNLSASAESEPVINYLLRDEKNKRVLIGTRNSGLIIYEMAKRQWLHFPELTENDDRRAGNIQHVYQDRYDNIWVGTSSGIYLHYPLPVQTANLTHKRPSKKDCIWDIAAAANSDWWLGTQQGISRLSTQNRFIESYRPEFLRGSTLHESAVHAIYLDRNQYLWAGTLHNGLFKIDLKNETIRQILLKSIEKSTAKYFNNVYTMIPGRSSKLWIGTNGLGLVGFDLKNEKVSGFYYPSEQKVENHSLWITCLEKDGQDRLWAGMWLDGLAVFDPDERSWRVLNEIYKDAQLTHATVLSLCFQGDTLWIGTCGGGLNRLLLDTGQITCYSTRQGLPNNVIYTITPDNEGCLWLSTNKGLCRFNPKTENFRNFNREDRISGIEFNLGAAHRSADGRLYFGHMGGLQMVQPKEGTVTAAPDVQITSVRINGQERPISIAEHSVLELGSGDNRLAISFVGLFFRSPAKMEYAYCLEGFDEQWINCGQAREVTYSNLPPGDFTFRVRAGHANEVWSNAPAEFSVRIHPPYWKRWWFYLIGIVVAALILEGIHRMRIHQRLQLERTKHAEREKIQRKIAADFHDELGHRVTKIAYIGHMLKNDIEKPAAQAKEKLQKLIEDSDILLKEMREFVWELDPEKDTLYDLVEQLKSFSDDIFEQTGIAFRVERLPENCKQINLNLEWRKQILRLFKEAMHNILKHAQNCRNVMFSVKVKNNYLILSLTDDGCGFAGNAVRKNGKGLKNMRERAAALGGKLVIRNCNQNGTSVTFSGKLP